MPITSITTDYSNREKDLNIFPTMHPFESKPQQVRLGFGAVSSYCAGVQKLIQRYTILMLTNLGSQPAFPSFGTRLLEKTTTSSLSGEADLTHAFNFANSLVIDTLRRYQTTVENVPDDEQLDTAMLESVVVNTNLDVSYRVILYTKAGTEIPYVLPIPLS